MALARMVQEPQVVDVDIATRFVDDDEDVYVVRPGAGYSLYETFRDEGVAFLDFPGLELDFDRRPGRRDTLALREQLVRSIRIREWHLGGRHGREPARAFASYRGKAGGKRLGRYIGDIGRLYYDFEPGTIIVVPGPGYISDVLVGVIVGEPEMVADLRRYRDEIVPIRRVEWLGKKIKAAFSPDLRAYLARPDPVMRLDQDFREEILKVAFGQYAIDGEFSARLQTTKADFSTLDDFNVQTFINYVAGLAAAVERNPDADDEIDLREALVFLDNEPDIIPELASNINSPGFLRLSSSRTIPLVVVAIMSAVLATPAAAQLPEVRVYNSAVLKKDPCAVQIQTQVKRIMQVSSTYDLLEACRRLRDASARTGLKTAMPTRTRKQK